MSFFKDFKEDFTQAMNELMPDGNEMYDEELSEEALSGKTEETNMIPEPVEKKPRPVKDKQEKGVKERKTTQARKEKKEEPVEETEKRRVKMTRPPKEAPLKEKVTENVMTDEDIDIAPEDMLDQIDDLLDRELYSDESEPAALLRDDMEVNTMDMSVEELLSQLSEKQEMAKEDVSLPEELPSSVSEQEEEPELSIDDLLSQLENSIPEPNKAESKENQQKTDLSEAIVKEKAQSKAAVSETDMGLEELLDSISAKSNTGNSSKSSMIEPEISEEEVIEDISEEAEEIVDDIEELPEEPEEVEESLEKLGIAETDEKGLPKKPEIRQDEKVAERLMEEDKETVPKKTTAEEMMEAMLKELSTKSEKETVEKLPEEAAMEAMVEEVLAEELPEELIAEEPETPAVEESDEKIAGQIPQKVEKAVVKEIEESLEENEMSEEKDVISINPVEEKVAEIKEEPVFTPGEADDETTYITKGTKLKGDLETEGSIDIIGTIEGNVSCKGKVVVGGNVVGNLTAGELYANSARIEGDIKSYGSVKVGVGSMIIGGIEGESAVIAGAVNGDIDVKGPVIVDSTAVIMGNIKSRSVQINNGAVIEGFCSQSYSDIDVQSYFA